MKKNGKYRYSLQFGSESMEEKRAGELLERLGNKKSVVVVAALNDYIVMHPELEISNSKIEVKVDIGYNRETIEKIIRSVIEEKLKDVSHDYVLAENAVQETTDMLEEDVAQMLENLDLFQ